MSFGEQIRLRRSELRLTRVELAERLGVSPSAVSNYENGLSFPKEDVMLRLFDCLETEPNVLFRDSYREGGRSLSASEQALLRQYRGLSLKGRETVRSVVGAQYGVWGLETEIRPSCQGGRDRHHHPGPLPLLGAG